MRWSSLLVITALIPATSGCRVLGPLSPLRSVEQLFIYPQSVSPTLGKNDDAGGRQVWVETESHHHLDARYFEHPNPQAVVLYCHGNVGTVDKWALLAGRLSRMHRLSILVFDYPGYGRSSGIPGEHSIFQDAEAARQWLANENGIRPCDVVLMGRSLGGAVAVELAANGGARGLILESTFPSLPEVARSHAAWLLPEWNMTQRMNSVEKIRSYSGPLFQSHGAADRLIPLSLGKELFAAAPGPKRFIAVPEATHNHDHIRHCAAEREQFFRSLPPEGFGISATVALMD
jgi:pimeloyl-ACP methyl ester carboxylesterase